MPERTSPPPPDGQDLPAPALVALQRGRKLEAIKIVRETQGIGLLEARTSVEAYLAGQPQLQARFSGLGELTRRGCGLGLLFLAGLALAAALLLLRSG